MALDSREFVAHRCDAHRPFLERGHTKSRSPVSGRERNEDLYVDPLSELKPSAHRQWA